MVFREHKVVSHVERDTRAFLRNIAETLLHLDQMGEEVRDEVGLECKLLVHLVEDHAQDAFLEEEVHGFLEISFLSTWWWRSITRIRRTGWWRSRVVRGLIRYWRRISIRWRIIGVAVRWWILRWILAIAIGSVNANTLEEVVYSIQQDLPAAEVVVDILPHMV